ncbi:MAG: inorganic diphosphatase [Gammaproteobacteria bacterium]|nr:MAG: inorganic diphosphatase [Gammaproteobacteria bacterium]
MNINEIDIGDNVPDIVNAVIEIPSMGAPVKYELDKDSGALIVDRFFGTAMYYPCNYGFVPHTLSDDGDPVDILVVTRVPLLPGSIIAVRPVGMLAMADEAGQDTKIIAVPITKLTSMYANVFEPKDLPNSMLNEIMHFFEQYKALEPGKWVEVEGWQDSKAAKDDIIQSIARFDEQNPQNKIK